LFGVKGKRFLSARSLQSSSFISFDLQKKENMAEVTIAGMLLSPFLKAVYERVASGKFLDFFRGKLSDTLLKKLKMAMLPVNAVLEDAEDKQFTNPAVKQWLDELKDVIHEAEDVLDRIATKDLQRKLDAEFQTTALKVPISPISTSKFVNKIEGKIKEVVERLEELAKDIDRIGLREGGGGKPLERLPTTSLVEESDIFGRHDDKKAIINLLLSDDGACGNDMGVIAIVGMGGIGKTTLAQLVYNDNRVKDSFDLKAWVYVSDDFDVFKVTQTILEEIGSSTKADSKNLNGLHVTLENKLIGKKFLLVLDDVWNKNLSANWEALNKPFKSGAQGSRIIVTTRDNDVASIMHVSATATCRLKTLPEKDCWSLFVKHAFHHASSNAQSQLEALGRQIVEKCDGLPLAIKAIGDILSSKLYVDEWDEVLRSELWDSPIEETNILPALRLSYKYLPSHLKRCFAYCSIFPKNYVYTKDKLVLLWMAEGFLVQPKNKTMEELGNGYFIALVSRSLFQQSTGDKYIMHDLVSDIAKYISGQFTLRFEDDGSQQIVSKTRHLSYSCTKFQMKKFETFHEAKGLRTVLELNAYGEVIDKDASQFSLPMLKFLRVLSLSHYHDITELPDSIGKMIHLRYLDLSYTKIKRLPGSTCKLCNLQTLRLFRCENLATLPRDLHKLINLRHLEITATGIKEMPIHLGRLKCLQTLSTFMVSKHSEYGIQELRKLTNLRGSLSILELQNVRFPTDAKDVNLRDWKHLEKLVLEWKADTNVSESHKIVLDGLQPHSNLKSLDIKGYGGKSFPDCVGDASFSNITSLRLENCKFCCSLPPLGQLPSLQYLSIVGLGEVVTVGPEFYGSGSSSMKPFGALKVLSFWYMWKWEEWFCFEVGNDGGAFPNLRELEIHECRKLTRGLPVHLPSLVKLVIRECPQLVASLPRASSQCKLILKNCNTILLNEWPTGKQELGIQQFDACALELSILGCGRLELPMHLGYSSLEYLKLDLCDSLKFFPIYLFPNLLRLHIRGCGNLKSLTVGEQHEHDLLLSVLIIDECPDFAYFPKQGFHAPNLKEFTIITCGSLQSLPDKMNILLPLLEKLHVEDCPEIEYFHEGALPSNLNEISIFNCEKLFASQMGWGLQKLQSVRRFIICGKYEDVESFPEVGLLPTSLTFLYINGFRNLRSLDKMGLQHLTALKGLDIQNCPKLECMPKEGLPASLSSLHIYRCPLLEKEWERKGEEWNKISHVRNKWINLGTKVLSLQPSNFSMEQNVYSSSIFV